MGAISRIYGGDGYIEQDDVHLTTPGFFFRAGLYSDGGLPAGVHELAEKFPGTDRMGVHEGYFGPSSPLVRDMATGVSGHQDTYIASFDTFLGMDVAALKHLRTMNGAAFVELGRDDNVEVGVQWYIPDFLAYHHQVGPCAFMTLEPDPLLDEPNEKLGIAYNFDVGLYRFGGGQVQVGYLQNVFAVPDGEQGLNFDLQWYTPIQDSVAGYAPSLVGGNCWIVLRCVNGLMQTFLAAPGEPLTAAHPPVARPSWANNRDGWGCRSLSLWAPVGELYYDPVDPQNGTSAAPATQVFPPQIKQWYARPYEIPLV